MSRIQPAGPVRVPASSLTFNPPITKSVTFAPADKRCPQPNPAQPGLTSESIVITTALRSADYAILIRRLVRGDLAREVHVLDSGESDGAPWVRIACDSRVACKHAMMSLAPYARNPIAEWTEGWQPAVGHLYTLRVRELRDTPYDD